MTLVSTEWLNENLNEIKIIDGSGLSRKNLISPNVLIEVLKSAYHDRKVFNYFYNF